jgi:hypothetical protein
MLGAKRIGNAVFLAKPAAKVNQFAAAGAKWPELTFKPCSLFFAGRASNGAFGVHEPIYPSRWLMAKTNETGIGTNPGTPRLLVRF